MIKRYLQKLAKSFTVLFYKRNEDVYVFISFILLISVMQKCFYIKNFNYLYIVLLYFAGVIFYSFIKKVYKAKIFKVILLLLISALIYLIFHFYKYIEMHFYQLYVKNLIDIYNDFYKSEQINFNKFLPFYIILIPIIAAVNKYLFSKSFEHIISAAIFICMLFFWYFGYDSNIKIYMFIYLFITAGILVINRYKRNIKAFTDKGFGIHVNRENIILPALLMCSAIVIITILMIKVVGNKNIWEITEQINEVRQRYRVVASYDISYSGYNEGQTELGGPVLLKKDNAFIVNSDASYYLKGIAKDYYDGYKWTNSGVKSPSISEIIEIDQMNNLQIGMKKDFVKNSLVIYPQNQETRTLFVPNLTYDIRMKDGEYQKSDGGVYSVKGGHGANGYYRVSFFTPQILIDDLNGEILTYTSGKDRQLIDAYYKNKIYEQYKKYLQIPDNISTEVYKLANSIKGESDTVGKLKNIKKHLIENYEYSLDVSDVPENTEFLEHFLINEKKGYCTYFATAATIFCRMSGIPARMVEGYKMKDNRDADGFYAVTEDMAHAWTEVLISPEQNIWGILDCVPADYETEVKDYLQTYDYKSGTEPSLIIKGLSKLRKQKNSKTKYNSLYGIFAYPYIILAASFIIVIIWSILRFINHKRYMKYVLENRSAIPFYNYVRKRLVCAGISKPENNDDIKWLSGIKDEKLRTYMENLVDAVYKEFYGNRIDGVFDKKSCYIYVEQYIKSKQNKLFYLIKKYSTKYINKRG